MILEVVGLILFVLFVGDVKVCGVCLLFVLIVDFIEFWFIGKVEEMMEFLYGEWSCRVLVVEVNVYFYF
jgi:hypothetical protein